MKLGPSVFFAVQALNDDQIASFGCQSGEFYQYSVSNGNGNEEMLPPPAMDTMVVIQITTCHAIKKR